MNKSSERELREIIRRITGRGYSAYRELKAKSFIISFFEIFFVHIQPDPFAPASRVRLRVPMSMAGFPQDTFRNKSREIGLRDFILREFERNAKKISRKRGEGKSGLIYSYKPSQEMLERTSVYVDREWVEVRFFMGLPSKGRRILGKEFEEMLFKDLPAIVERSLIFKNLDKDRLYLHIETSEDADFLRQSLKKLGLVAFIKDGSILPRRSGIDDRPMEKEKAVPFKSPEDLRIEIELPNRGRITGMGIPEGVTLIVGGGFHGKTTLLKSIERGVYNHIPGDGRELVVTLPWAVKIRAEDGRSVTGVDISPFISNLPQGIDTKFFTTENASGSTSQSANIVEAVEAGAELLLIDEDTSATNFMIRDERMQRLIEKGKEPITPFVDKVRLLFRDYKISTILVMGGSGDYFDVADTVIGMVNYRPINMTERVKEIIKEIPLRRKGEGGKKFGEITPRIPLKENLDLKNEKIKVKGRGEIVFGKKRIDISLLEQVVEEGQTRGISHALVYVIKNYVDGRMTLRDILKLLKEEMDKNGLDSISISRFPPDLAWFRIVDFAATFNRIRGLKVISKSIRIPAYL